MSDVREQLRDCVWGITQDSRCDVFVDAILARFDVEPKPVVTDLELGNWVLTSAAINDDPDVAARRFRSRLEDAGLAIVRIEEAD